MIAAAHTDSLTRTNSNKNATRSLRHSAWRSLQAEPENLNEPEPCESTGAADHGRRSVGSFAAFAATLTVCASGCQYSTIQGAIDHAANGDTISIEKGHYFETINTKGKGLTLQGVNSRQTSSSSINRKSPTVPPMPSRTSSPLACVSCSSTGYRCARTRDAAPSGPCVTRSRIPNQPLVAASSQRISGSRTMSISEYFQRSLV